MHEFILNTYKKSDRDPSRDLEMLKMRQIQKGCLGPIFQIPPYFLENQNSFFKT
jgi:hypothetical protein